MELAHRITEVDIGQDKLPARWRTRYNSVQSEGLRDEGATGISPRV